MGPDTRLAEFGVLPDGRRISLKKGITKLDKFKKEEYILRINLYSDENVFEAETIKK